MAIEIEGRPKDKVGIDGHKDKPRTGRYKDKEGRLKRKIQRKTERKK